MKTAAGNVAVRRDLVEGQRWLATLSRASPSERIRALRKGFPAQTVTELANMLGWPRAQLVRYLGLKPSTILRRLRTNAPLDLAASERVLAILDLVNFVDTIVARSGNPEHFHAARWLSDWLTAPTPAFGATIPAELLDTNEGVRMIRQILAQMETGAYA